MSKFTMDYSKLEQNVYKNSYKLRDVKDQIEKVAFDIVRFKDGDKAAELWQVQSADDGDYIIALYNENTEETKVASQWDVSICKFSQTLQISYKGDPILKIASDKLGIPKSEIQLIPSYLPEKLAQNKKLVKQLLSEVPLATKQQILQKYPELL